MKLKKKKIKTHIYIFIYAICLCASYHNTVRSVPSHSAAYRFLLARKLSVRECLFIVDSRVYLLHIKVAAFFFRCERYTDWFTLNLATNRKEYAHTYIQELGLKCMRMCVKWMWFLFLSLCRFIFFRWIFFSSSVFHFLYFHYIFSPSFSFVDYFPDSIFKCVYVCLLFFSAHSSSHFIFAFHGIYSFFLYLFLNWRFLAG